jgi:hypothetical protein
LVSVPFEFSSNPTREFIESLYQDGATRYRGVGQRTTLLRASAAHQVVNKRRDKITIGFGQQVQAASHTFSVIWQGLR